jgi:hypothetical protein
VGDRYLRGNNSSGSPWRWEGSWFWIWCLLEMVTAFAYEVLLHRAQPCRWRSRRCNLMPSGRRFFNLRYGGPTSIPSRVFEACMIWSDSFPMDWRSTPLRIIAGRGIPSNRSMFLGSDAWRTPARSGGGSLGLHWKIFFCCRMLYVKERPYILDRRSPRTIFPRAFLHIVHATFQWMDIWCLLDPALFSKKKTNNVREYAYVRERSKIKLPTRSECSDQSVYVPPSEFYHVVWMLLRMIWSWQYSADFDTYSYLFPGLILDSVTNTTT